MTVLFKQKDSSYEDSITTSFTNLKEKLREYETKEAEKIT